MLYPLSSSQELPQSLRTLLESIWDLEDLHRNLIHQVTELAYRIDAKTRHPVATVREADDSS